jgi:hypothetical protein
MSVDIRDRRDIYLNNERFIVKGGGFNVSDPRVRWQIRLMGVNVLRGPHPRTPEMVDRLYSEGLLTSLGPAMASCEPCMFWNSKDTSNIDKAVKLIVKEMGQCPGIVQWEVTNEMFGEPDECRVAIQSAFHRYDPYHRPVLATKASGEWEAVVKDGRIAGVDIVGCQYLVSKEVTDAAVSAMTEQPIMCTEVNWNDGFLTERDGWKTWLERGLSGVLLFDYSGNSLDQPVPLVPMGDNEDGRWVRQTNRGMLHDVVADAVRGDDRSVEIRLGNRMPYTLRRVDLTVRELGQVRHPDLDPGDRTILTISAEAAVEMDRRVELKVEYVTHGGLSHISLLAPEIMQEGGR